MHGPASAEAGECVLRDYIRATVAGGTQEENLVLGKNGYTGANDLPIDTGKVAWNRDLEVMKALAAVSAASWWSGS